MYELFTQLENFKDYDLSEKEGTQSPKKISCFYLLWLFPVPPMTDVTSMKMRETRFNGLLSFRQMMNVMFYFSLVSFLH